MENPAGRFPGPPVKIGTISSVFNLLQSRLLLASMLQGAVMAPCTMCTWDEYSGKSSCTRLWHASIVGVPWHRDMKNRFPHRSPRFGLRGCSPGPRRFLGKAETGIKWKLNVFVSRAHIIIRGTISVWTGIPNSFSILLNFCGGRHLEFDFQLRDVWTCYQRLI